MGELVYCLWYNTSKNFPFGEHLTRKMSKCSFQGVVVVVVVVISKQIETILEFSSRDPLINVVKSVIL